MPLEGIAAGLSGLLGGYVQGQRLKQEFDASVIDDGHPR